MLHLTARDYHESPWKNGRGTTCELWRLERQGRLIARISRANVIEDGPFSLFPALRRSLTVISGKGFRLRGEGLDLACTPLVPVAFPGGLAVQAEETHDAPSEDLNIMTMGFLAPPEVRVLKAETSLARGGLLAIYALNGARTNGREMAAGDLILSRAQLEIAPQGAVIAARLAI